MAMQNQNLATQFIVVHKTIVAFAIGTASLFSVVQAQQAASYVEQPRHVSKWVVVENNKYQTVEYDANSIDHYDNNNPQVYFPRDSNFHGVIIRTKFRNSTPTNGPDADTRVELEMFNCDNATSVPVWIELSFRGYLIKPRAWAPEAQLRNGFEPVVNQWFPAGSAPDKIYRVACAAKIDNQQNQASGAKNPRYSDSSFDWDHDAPMSDNEYDIGSVITECKVNRGQAKAKLAAIYKKIQQEQAEGKDPTNGNGGNSIWAMGVTCK